MKRLLITSIAALSIIGGGVLFMGGDSKDIVPQINNVVEVAPPAITETVNTPVAKVAEEPVIEVEVEHTIVESPVIEPAKTVYTFDELQFKYVTIRGTSELHSFIRRISTVFPERFTPDNMEASFEYINNFFDKNSDYKEKLYYYNPPEVMATFPW